MKKTNIIFFTWENKVFLKKELDLWIEHFIEKYWENNISKISKSQLNSINIEQELTSLPFLSEKKLIILYDIPFSWDSKEQDDAKYDDDKIVNLLNKIPDNNFVLFVQENPDKRKILYKKLIEIATIKEYSIPDEYSLKSYVKDRLPLIESAALDKIIFYKNKSLEKIEQEIEKLILYKPDSIITVNDIDNFVTQEIESSIFTFLDRLLELNYNKAIENLELLLINTKIEPTFAAIMTSLRKYLFTIYLSKNWIKEWEIISLLKLHPFIYKKNIWNSRNYNEILHIYNKFCKVDSKAKNGQLIWDAEDNIKIAIEKVIFDLKKEKNLIKY